MARLESTANLGFVPTPGPVCDALAAWLACPPDLHALDPCCADGSALRRIVPAGTLYGIELSMGRAMAAKRKIDRVIAGDALAARIGHGSMGLVFLNPPYDDDTTGRLELRFLERAVNWLAPGGVLVQIIKQDQYSAKVLRVLARHFTQFRHWRFPDPYFDGPELAYHQTVLVCRRGPGLAIPLPDFARESLGLSGPLPPLAPPGPGESVRPPSGVAPKVFTSGALDREDLAELLRHSPLSRRPASPETPIARPPLPLEDGHAALALASGAIDGIFGSGLSRHVAKGTVTRSEVKESRWAQVSERTGEARMLIESKTDTFRIQIRALRPDGTIHNMTGAPLVPKNEDEQEDDADAA